jgi:RNA polymerase sigma-70 factor (ECF subfamily)
MTREDYEVLALKLAPALKRASVRLAFPDLALAEDLVQTALVRGYQMMLDGRFVPGEGSLTWFLRTVTNDFLAHRRKHGRCHVVPPDSGVFIDRASAATPESLLLAEAKSERLMLALDGLPPEQRACVELVDLAECSYAEAADALGVPVGTVRSRLSRARLFVAGHMRVWEEME